MQVNKTGLVVAALVVGTSCVGSDPANGGEECTVRMKWMQKDAYAEYAGRTSAAWPPHTTMAMELDCEGLDDDGEQVNHGTSIDDELSDGTQILEEVKRDSLYTSEAEATALLAAFESCHCDGTDFLSLNDVQDSVVQDVIGEMLGYLNTNMTCTGGITPAGIVGKLQANNPDGALADLDMCSFNSGHSWETAFEASLQSAEGSLSGYHVCNNDAMLQTQLWEDFADGDGVVACNGSASVCSGPEFFYNP